MKHFEQIPKQFEKEMINYRTPVKIKEVPISETIKKIHK